MGQRPRHHALSWLRPRAELRAATTRNPSPHASQTSMITIVTAFFDIGREHWSAYGRSVDTYFKRFERLCRLENDIVLFTESRHQKRLEKIQAWKPNLTVHYKDQLFDEFAELLQRIEQTQRRVDFRDGITNPDSPEYNEPKYVLINYLKSRFCVEAIERDRPSSDMVAWIDFGYLRKSRQLPVSLRWDFGFEKKIHLFQLLPLGRGFDLVKTIKDNTVHIQGCHIIASQSHWPIMARLMQESIESLLDRGLIDDDQTLLAMSCLKAPEQFVLHPADIQSKLGWFFVFRRFNTEDARVGVLDHLRFHAGSLAHLLRRAVAGRN